MLPSEYVSEIVLPTVDEYLAATGDLRRAILACGVTYHVRDYLAVASGCSKQEVDRRIKAICAFSFDVVDGVCNGSKHVRNTIRGDFKYSPGDERSVPIFALGVAGAGLDDGRWSIPGLEVEHQGRREFIDFCLCDVLEAIGRAFPAEFSSVDLEGCGKRVRIAVSQAAFDAIAKTLALGSVGFESKTDEKGQRLIWLDRAVVDRLRVMRGPDESYSDSILRLAAAG
jgi:hypothetical protein